MGATVALQIATVSVPVLRTLLGLEPLDASAYAVIAAALAMSVIGAVFSARHSLEKKSPGEGRADVAITAHRSRCRRVGTEAPGSVEPTLVAWSS